MFNLDILLPSELDTALCDKVCQWLMTGLWFSLVTMVSSINKTDCQDITEILLKVALNTITLTLIHIQCKSIYLLLSLLNQFLLPFSEHQWHVKQRHVLMETIYLYQACQRSQSSQTFPWLQLEKNNKQNWSAN